VVRMFSRDLGVHVPRCCDRLCTTACFGECSYYSGMKMNAAVLKTFWLRIKSVSVICEVGAMVVGSPPVTSKNMYRTGKALKSFLPRDSEE